MKLTVSNLKSEALREHKAAFDHAQQCVSHVIKCGKILIALKQAVGDGQWGATLDEMGLPRVTAWRYIRVAEDAALNSAKVKYLLEKGASLVDLYREFNLVKPLPMAGYDADKYEQRKALAQLEMAFSYDQSLEAVRAIHKAKLSELSERSLKVLLRDTEEAKAHLEAEISSRTGRVIDLDDTHNEPKEKQP